jgi:glucokinase
MTDGEMAIGVDIGGTKVFGVMVDGAGEIVSAAKLTTPRSFRTGDPQVLLETVLEVVDVLSARVPVQPAPPVGIGVPGLVDRAGRLRFSPHLPEAEGLEFGNLLLRTLANRSVVVENDANCAARAELEFGSLQGVADGLMVTLGTGIGGALISGGRLLTGASGFAGEVGHMVVDPSGPPCPCGGRGCWERYASGGGLGRLAREAAAAGRLTAVVEDVGGDPENVHGEDVTNAARSGDSEALAVLAELGWWLALGLANLTAVLDPRRCVVGGGLAEAGALLLDPARKAFDELVEGGRARPGMELVAAGLGERAGAVGAALVARDGRQ